MLEYITTCIEQKRVSKKMLAFVLLGDGEEVTEGGADGGEVEVVCVDLGVGAGLVEWFSGLELLGCPGGEEFFTLLLCFSCGGLGEEVYCGGAVVVEVGEALAKDGRRALKVDAEGLLFEHLCTLRVHWCAAAH